MAEFVNAEVLMGDDAMSAVALVTGEIAGGEEVPQFTIEAAPQQQVIIGADGHEPCLPGADAAAGSVAVAVVAEPAL